MRFLLELLSLLALAVGFMLAASAALYCWQQAIKYDQNGGHFAIAGAVLTGLLAVALVIYLKPGREE